MKRLENVCKKLDILAGLTGKNAKKAYLEANIGDVDFRTLLTYRYDIFKTYGIKKFPSITYTVTPTLTFDTYATLLDELANSNINDTLRKKAESTIASGNYIYSHIIEGIITKGLSLGVDTTVKKLLKLTEISPALASPIKEDTDVVFPKIVELKYDGVRCIAMIEHNKCKLYTRQGRLLSFPQIESEFLKLANGEDITFDTELEMAARTGISGVCNSNLKTGYTQGADDFIEVYIFDEIPTKTFKSLGKTKKQKDRTLDLQKRFANFTQAKRLKLGESQTVNSMSKLKEINNKYITLGFEGVIVKDPEAIYAFKRSQSWLKMKAINSTTLEIIGVTPGKGKAAGTVGNLICKSSCGKLVVGVGSGLSDEERMLFTKVSPIGKFAEVLFNVVIKGRDSITYSLFLPRFKSGEVLRIDKDEADSLQKILNEHIGKVGVS